MHMHVLIGDHRATTVPPTFAHDVHPGCVECIRGSDDGADVQIMLPILDRHMERVSTRIEIGDDGRIRPVAILITDVAPISVLEEFAIESIVIGPWSWMGTDPDLAILAFDELVEPGLVSHGVSSTEQR